MLTNVGDRVVVDAECDAHRPRRGVVTEVRGSLVTVDWDDGGASTFAPVPGTVWAPDQWEEWRKTTRRSSE